MAPKRKRNLPTKKSVNTSERLFGKDGNTRFKVKDYLVNKSVFEIFQGTKIENQIILEALTAITIVHLLAQIRLCSPSVKPDEIDKRRSTKFYKRKFIANLSGRIFGLAIAISRPEVILVIDDEGDKLADWVNKLLYSYVGNERKLTVCTPENRDSYIHGVLSRVIGVLNGCPSTNLVALGIPQSSASWSIKEVLNNIDFDVQEYPVNKIIENIRNIAFEDKGNLEDNTSLELQFSEPPLPSSTTVNGNTVLEKEIFGEGLKRDIDKTQKKANIDRPPIYSRKSLEGLVSVLKIKKYESYVEFKNWTRVRELNEDFKLIVDADKLESDEIIENGGPISAEDTNE